MVCTIQTIYPEESTEPIPNQEYIKKEYTKPTLESDDSTGYICTQRVKCFYQQHKRVEVIDVQSHWHF